MENAFSTIIFGYVSLALYKITTLVVGLALAYMGYRLFMAGIWGNAGDLEAKYGNQRLVIKAAAPGTFFALFGTIVLTFTIWKGLELNKIEAVEGKAGNIRNIGIGELKKLDEIKPPFSNK